MTRERLLYGIESPADLRRLPAEQIEQVAEEVRQEILERVSQTGGHLASSLGAVELITGIHYVFDTPTDRLVFDVGHQAYAHKMLTGRRQRFESIGQAGGISKFLRKSYKFIVMRQRGNSSTAGSKGGHAGQEMCPVPLAKLRDHASVGLR